MLVDTPIKRCEPTTFAFARAARRAKTDEILTDDGGATFFVVNAAFGRFWRSREMAQLFKPKGNDDDEHSRKSSDR